VSKAWGHFHLKMNYPFNLNNTGPQNKENSRDSNQLNRNRCIELFNNQRDYREHRKTRTGKTEPKHNETNILFSVQKQRQAYLIHATVV